MKLWAENRESISFTEPIRLRFCVMEMTDLVKRKKYFNTIFLFSGVGYLQLHFMDADCFVITCNVKGLSRRFKKWKTEILQIYTTKSDKNLIYW